jgi:CBS domain containing-hemolysin-like protein
MLMDVVGRVFTVSLDRHGESVPHNLVFTKESRGNVDNPGTWVWNLLGLLSIPALVAFNGLFVAAEFALVSLRRTRVEELVNQGIAGAKSIQAALDRLDRTIAATQLGVTLSSIGLGWVGEPALARLIAPAFEGLTGVWHTLATHSAATILAFLIITFMHVVFGELVPKAWALQTPDRTALWMAKPLIAFAKITRPLTWLMSITANGVIRLLGYEPPRGEQLVHSVEELQLLIEDTEEAGILDSDQADIVQNIFEMSEKCVKECLVPVEKMATLEVNSPPDKVLEAVRQGAHTRMPVYEGTIDNIVGIVNTKDLFYLFSLKGMVILQDALYPALFLRPDNTVAEALKLFRKAHRPMALVRDENSKILGLITLEDVLEEIVGELEDEHDRPTPKLVRRRVAVAKPGAPKPAPLPKN